MKPISCSVDWKKEYSNYPELQIVVDEFPKKEDLRFKYNEKGLWFAEKDGLVSFFDWNGPKNEGGYYGREFSIKLEDNSEIILLGPWSSRSGVMNKYFTPQCLEVNIKTQNNISTCWFSGVVTLEFALEAIKLCEEPVELVVDYKNEEYYFVPKRKEI